jgi:type II secretory pathway component PulM
MINLTDREQKLLKILAGIIAIAAVYLLIIRPLSSFRERTGREFDNNTQNLIKLDKIFDEYIAAKEKNARYNSLLKNSSGLTTLIEENAQSVNILKNKSYNRDNPSSLQNKYRGLSTEVKFEGVDIKSVVNFIYKMENSNRLVKISYLNIKQALNQTSTYDVIIKFDSYYLE